MKSAYSQINLEELASILHEIWGSWTRYMLTNLTDKNIKRWKKQIETPYKKLTELEKDSDRTVAKRLINELTKANDFSSNTH